jgi:NADH-quinone oxidoreductase subunit J
VILVRNPVHAALFLVLAFVTAAVLWLCSTRVPRRDAGARLRGRGDGALLFVVMMLDINLDRLREGFWGNLPLAARGHPHGRRNGAAADARGGARPFARRAAPGFSTPRRCGQVLYTDYVYAFELAAIVLLVAIVAAIAITLRNRKETKYQNPAAQLSVKASDP